MFNRRLKVHIYERGIANTPKPQKRNTVQGIPFANLMVYIWEPSIHPPNTLYCTTMHPSRVLLPLMLPGHLRLLSVITVGTHCMNAMNKSIGHINKWILPISFSFSQTAKCQFYFIMYCANQFDTHSMFLHITTVYLTVMGVS